MSFRRWIKDDVGMEVPFDLDFPCRLHDPASFSEPSRVAGALVNVASVSPPNRILARWPRQINSYFRHLRNISAEYKVLDASYVTYFLRKRMKVIHYFLHLIAGMEKGCVVPLENLGEGHPAYQGGVAVLVG